MKREEAYRNINQLIDKNKNQEDLIKTSVGLGKVIGRDDVIQELKSMNKNIKGGEG